MALNSMCLMLAKLVKQVLSLNLFIQQQAKVLTHGLRFGGKKSRTVQNHARKVVTEMQKREKVAKGKGKDNDLSIEELESQLIVLLFVLSLAWYSGRWAGYSFQFP